MHIEVKIVATNQPEIAKLVSALSALSGVEVTASVAKGDVVEETPKTPKKPARSTAKSTAKKEEEPVAEDDLPYDDVDDEPETISDEAIRAACQAKDRAKVQALVKKCGYQNVLKIPQEERAEFLAKVEALK